MKRIAFFTVLFFILVLYTSCYKDQVVYNSIVDDNCELSAILKFNGKSCCYDYHASCLRFPIDSAAMNNFFPYTEFQDFASVTFDGRELNNHQVNNLGDICYKRSYEISVEVHGEKKCILLQFTNLPVVQVITPNTIYDEPKTLARIDIHFPEQGKASETYVAGIEYRGKTSQQYPKKSYGFSLKGSFDSNDDRSYALFDMKSNNDWILDAMWIDNGRMRNIASFELWDMMDDHKYQGISGVSVELFLNNEHQGLYSLNENINAEHLGLTNTTGVLYKAYDWGNGATTFEFLNDEPPGINIWDSWEQKYPDPKSCINWDPLYELRWLVVNEDDAFFTEKIISSVDIWNFVDYYLFLNLTFSLDNIGKNTFLVKEDCDDLFRIIPWDMDGSWGVFWDGTHTGYQGMLSNNLFDRMQSTNAGDFNTLVIQRWYSLRGNIFSEENLRNHFSAHFNTLTQSDIMDQENAVWDRNIDMETEKDYLFSWIHNRLVWLDTYFQQEP